MGHSSADAPGRVSEGAPFGAYLLEACLEQGPMGRVFRAEHQGLKRRVALKVLDASCASLIDLGQFIEQARAATSVRHPAIVNVFDAGIHDGVAYVVTDLVEGVSLRDLLAERGPLDETTIVDIAVPLASALVALHDAGIVHDDLSPARVFLSEVGAGQMRARMVDVTHSRLWRASRSVSGVSAIASPLYMAPEVVLGGAEGPLSDQYQLGVLMYECATGVNPFALDDQRAALQRITAGEVEPLSSRKSSLSKRLAALIERAMHVDPARRFSSMRELGHELSSAAGRRTRITWGLGSGEAGAEHGAAELPPPAAPLPPPARRRRRGARLLAWASLALVAGLALGNVDAIAGLWRASSRGTTAPAPSRVVAVHEPRPVAPAPAHTEEPGAGAAPSDAVPVPAEAQSPPAPLLSSSPPPRPARASQPRAAAVSREPAGPVARRPKRPAAEPPVPDSEPDWMASPGAAEPLRSGAERPAPDWMITPEDRSPQPSFERGTNQALILD